MVLEKNTPAITQQMKWIYVAGLSAYPDLKNYFRGQKAALSLQEAGLRVFMAEPSTNLGDHLKRAAKMGASFAVISGDDELRQNSWTIKDLNTREQFSAAGGQLLFELMKRTKELQPL